MTDASVYYLNACHHFQPSPPQHSDAELNRLLRQDYGIDARRLSRFSRLCLLGALPLRPQLPAEAALFLASPFASPAKFAAAFAKLNREQLPSLLDFTANLHNAAAFHLMQTLAGSGGSTVVAADADNYLQPLLLALAALDEPGCPAALIGWILERQQADEADGSIFWLLSRRPAADAFARIRLLPAEAPPTAPVADSSLNRRARAFFPAVCAMQAAVCGQAAFRHPQQGLCPPFVTERLQSAGAVP